MAVNPVYYDVIFITAETSKSGAAFETTHQDLLPAICC